MGRDTIDVYENQDFDLGKVVNMFGDIEGFLAKNPEILGLVANMFGNETKVEEKRSHSSRAISNKKLKVLGALKPIVSAERAAIIDTIIQIYIISKIIKE